MDAYKYGHWGSNPEPFGWESNTKTSIDDPGPGTSSMYEVVLQVVNRWAPASSPDHNMSRVPHCGISCHGNRKDTVQRLQ